MLALLKRDSLQHMCFLLKSGTFLKTPFFIEHIRWVLLCLPPFSCISYQKTWTDFSRNFHKNPKLFRLELKTLNRKKDQKNLQIVKFLLFFFTDNYTLFGTSNCRHLQDSQAIFTLLVRYSYLSILPDDNGDNFAGSSLILLFVNCYDYFWYSF